MPQRHDHLFHAIAAFSVQGPKDVLVNGTAAGVMHEDLRVAIERALLLRPEDCRTFALQYSWSACTTQFLQNL
ncbi:MAG: hypothetical protein ACK52I_07075, partial [Pseudomonadota bacterium]